MALLWILLGLSACDSLAEPELCSGDGMPSQGDHCFSGGLAGVHLRMASEATGTLTVKFVQEKNEAECRGMSLNLKGVELAGNRSRCPLLDKYEAKYCSDQDKLLVNFTEANRTAGLVNFTRAVLAIDMSRANCSMLFRNVTHHAHDAGKAEQMSGKSLSLRGEKAKTSAGRVCCEHFSTSRPSSFSDAMQARENCEQAYGPCSHQYIHYHIDNTHVLNCFGRHCWGG
ncbi:unnamed protein product [Symbiodinium sp. CCMP2592]|nr:unnamed protein product [Symbiodinium sp. CCMP2592]